MPSDDNRGPVGVNLQVPAIMSLHKLKELYHGACSKVGSTQGDSCAEALLQCAMYLDTGLDTILFLLIRVPLL